MLAHTILAIGSTAIFKSNTPLIVILIAYTHDRFICCTAISLCVSKVGVETRQSGIMNERNEWFVSLQHIIIVRKVYISYHYTPCRAALFKTSLIMPRDVKGKE